MYNPLQPQGLSPVMPLYSPLSPGVCSNSCPLGQWCYLTIWPSATPFTFAFNPSCHQGLFKWVRSSNQVPKILDLQFHNPSSQWILKLDFHYDWLIWSPCCPGNPLQYSCLENFMERTGRLQSMGLQRVGNDWETFTFTLSLAVQGSLKSLLQHPNFKASVIWYPSCFIVQHSHSYMTTRKTKNKKHSFDYTELCRQSNVTAF